MYLSSPAISTASSMDGLPMTYFSPSIRAMAKGFQQDSDHCIRGKPEATRRQKTFLLIQPGRDFLQILDLPTFSRLLRYVVQANSTIRRLDKVHRVRVYSSSY